MTTADPTSPTIEAGSPADRSHSSRLARSAAWSAAAILVGLSGVCSYWAAGGEWATDTSFRPWYPLVQYGTLCVLMIGSAALVLARAGIPIVSVPVPVLRVGPGALAGAFAVMGLSTLVAPNGPSASDWLVYVFEPLLPVLAVLCAIVGGSEPGPAPMEMDR